MLDYALARQQLLTEVYRNQVNEFTRTYRRKRPTVVLLPGGMGSQLDRSKEAFKGVHPDQYTFDPVWMDAGILFDGDGLKLEIETGGRDKGGHFVVPNGPLRFLILAYDRTSAWADEHGFNFVVFGYDWRHPLGDAAEWLQRFLSFLRAAVLARHGEDPLPTTTLVAHSQGGLVAMHFLRRYPLLQWANRLITVATPFYGTWSHGDRYYVGQSPLDRIHGKAEVARIAATLPGPYVLMPLPKHIFDRDWRRIGFGSKEDYPVRDATSGAPIDPYNANNLGRYPPWIDADHLSLATQALEVVAAPVEDAVARRITCIGATGDASTPVLLRWRSLPSGFDPDRDGTSFIGVAGAPGGDGTVPGWSAFHAAVPKSNRVTISNTQESDHTFLMETDAVLDTIGPMLDASYGGVTVAAPRPRSMLGPSASPDEVRALADDVRRGRAGRDDPRLFDERTWRGLVRELSR